MVISMSTLEKRVDEILEVVLFMKEHIIRIEDRLGVIEQRLDSIESRTGKVERDVHGLYNRLDDELDKRKVLEVRVGRLETRKA